MKSFLLDTSILEAHTIKVPVVSAVVADACRRMRRRGAAEYAILEYHNAVIAQIEYLLDLFKQKKDIERVREHINRVTGASHATRKANMCREILTRLEFDLRTRFDPNYPRDAADFHQKRAVRACSLLREIQKCWLRDLRRIVDVWERDTGCYWVRRIEAIPLRQPKTVKVRCTAENVRCDLIRLLKLKRGALARVRATIDGLSAKARTAELRGLADAIARFEKEATTSADYRKGCRCFADLLHVLQAERYDAIYTMNSREFITLCATLGKPLVIQDHRGNPPNLEATVPETPSA